MSSFAELFNLYRLKAGFRTLGEFGKALAEEGYVYEDSIFSKWKSGERIPRDRDVILAICKTFTSRQAIHDISVVNKALNSIGLKDLSEDEISYLSLDQAIKPSNYLTKYSPIREPSTLFHNLIVTSQNTRTLEIDAIPINEYRNYWKHEVYCAAAGYYSLTSNGKTGPADFYRMFSDDPFEANGCLSNIVSITTDEMTGQEFLSATVVLIQGCQRCSAPISSMQLYDVDEKWPHEAASYSIDEIGELTRFILPNWAWDYRTQIIRTGFDLACDIARRKGIKLLYSIISPVMISLLDECGIKTRVIENGYPLYQRPDVKESHPIAYKDYQDYYLFWKSDPKLYVFEDYSL